VSDQTVDIEAVLHTAVNAVHRANSEYVERDDLEQEVRLWMAGHPKRMDDLVGWNNWNWVSSALMAPALTYARKQKAQVLGYQPDDEHFYSTGVLAAILPHWYHETQPSPEGPSAKTDPAEGGNWAAIVLDVERAMESLSVDDNALISVRWCMEKTIDETATELDLTYDEARRRSERAMKRLIVALGGERPRQCPPNCEHYEHDARLRTRPNSWTNRSGEGQVLS
jgi:RNA polymerase sigma factor (sigma-70 family)